MILRMLLKALLVNLRWSISKTGSLISPPNLLKPARAIGTKAPYKLWQVAVLTQIGFYLEFKKDP